MKTLADLYAHLRSYLGNDTSAQKAAAVARSAAAAVRLLPTEHNWEFYRELAAVTTSAEYTTGTITYVESTRTATIASGTWPTWAGGGTIEIGGTPYDCEERVSGTDLLLLATSTPGANVAAGTSFRLYRSIYPLPANTTSVDEMFVANEGNWRRITGRHPREFLADRTPGSRSGVPEWYGFLGDADGAKLVIWPPSDQAYRLDFLRGRKPLCGRIQQEESGRATVAASGTSVTGTNSNFSSRHVGAVVRLSADSTPPTDETGLNPFAHESLIDAVASATALTLTTASSETLSKVAYIISSRLDVEDTGMWDLLCRLAERSLRQELQMNPTAEDGTILKAVRDVAIAVDNRRETAAVLAGSAMGRRVGGRFRNEMT